MTLKELLDHIYSDQHERGTMTVKTEKYVRKPFFVDAAQVTPENIAAVAEWAAGEVICDADGDHVKVRVHRPLNERQTKAFVGDWILYAGTGFKVYTNKAFAGCFERFVEVVELPQAEELPLTV